MTAEEIITAFQNKYSDLLGQDQSIAKTTTDSPSAFTTENSSETNGELGHTVLGCPKPRDENAIKLRRSICDGAKGGGRGRGGNSGVDVVVAVVVKAAMVKAKDMVVVV